jgi:ATP-binding cassette, subfamily C, type I secretion system permease/ATPase
MSGRTAPPFLVDSGNIALARTVFGSPALIVLDEPNAHLDAEGDQHLTRVITECKKRGQTVVVIAHRPSAISAVDKILILDGGQMRAFGPKDEVLSKALIPRIPQGGPPMRSQVVAAQ